MSEIPFVNRLGDAIETAATRRIAARRGYLRRLITGAAAVAVLGTGVAAASALFGDAQQLAAGDIDCYETTELYLMGDVGAEQPRLQSRVGEQYSPVAACAAEFGDSVPRVACDAGEDAVADGDGAVAVVPGRSPATCERLGLAALPADYATARERVRALDREVAALEASGCIPPPEFAERVQGLLKRAGWTGWEPQLRLDVEDGPCGFARGLTGDGRLSVEGGFDLEGRRVMVFGGPRR